MPHLGVRVADQTSKQGSPFVQAVKGFTVNQLFFPDLLITCQVAVPSQTPPGLE